MEFKKNKKDKNISKIYKPSSRNMIKPTRIKQFPIYATLKIDGSLQMLVKKEDEHYLLTKRGVKRIFVSPWFKEEIGEIPNDSLFMCELYGVKEEKPSILLDRRNMMSLITTQNSPLSDEKQMRLMVFSILRLGGKNYKKKYKDELKKLKELFGKNHYVHPPISAKIENKKELTRIWMEYVVKRKYEGLMKYEPDHIHPLYLKIKPLIDMDVIVLGFKKSGKQFAKGLLGSIEVGIYDKETNSFQKTNSLTIGVSPPFKGRDKTQLFLRRFLETIATSNGRVVKVKPKVVVEQTIESFYDSNGKITCQQPTFERIRFDKSTEDLSLFLELFRENEDTCFGNHDPDSEECLFCEYQAECSNLSESYETSYSEVVGIDKIEHFEDIKKLGKTGGLFK